jgi:hypothetical protein
MLDDEHLFRYLAPDGFLAYRWQGGNSEVLVHCAVVSSATATARALWSVVASHSSMAGTVRAFCGQLAGQRLTRERTRTWPATSRGCCG